MPLNEPRRGETTLGFSSIPHLFEQMSIHCYFYISSFIQYSAVLTRLSQYLCIRAIFLYFLKYDNVQSVFTERTIV